MELMDDKQFREEQLAKHPLMDASIYGSAVMQAKMKHAQSETAKKKRIELIERYCTEIEELKTDDSMQASNRRYLHYKLNKKKNRLERKVRKDSDITFGGKRLSGEITYNHNMLAKTGDAKYQTTFEVKKAEFAEKRILPYYVVGRACEGGNRKFDFDFRNSKITFKPSKGVKFLLEVHPGKEQWKILQRLQDLIDNNSISITVGLSTKKISITYDNELLNGYAFNDKLCKAQQSELPKECKEERKQVWINWKREQESRMLSDKIGTRFAGIDLNPEYIGLTIRDMDKILAVRCYDLHELVGVMKNNDTTEICFNLANIWKSIFKMLEHYQVSHLITEELDFKHSEKKSRSMNRKCKVAWCLDYQKGLIERRCQNTGIKHLEVNASYSSFVGNLMNPWFDPISASAEICRRGMIMKKVISEEWYPDLGQLHPDNIKSYVPDLEVIHMTVRALYKVFTSRDIRYRRLGKPQFKSKLIKCHILRC